jgi:hypothetical protein
MGWDRIIELRYGLYFEGHCFEKMAQQLYNLNTNPDDMLLNDDLYKHLDVELIATNGSPSKLWILHSEHIDILYLHIMSSYRCCYYNEDNYYDEMYSRITPIKEYKFSEDPIPRDAYNVESLILPDGTIEMTNQLKELNNKIKCNFKRNILPVELEQHILNYVEKNLLYYKSKKVKDILLSKFGWRENIDYYVFSKEQFVIHDYISY